MRGPSFGHVAAPASSPCGRARSLSTDPTAPARPTRGPVQGGPHVSRRRRIRVRLPVAVRSGRRGGRVRAGDPRGVDPCRGGAVFSPGRTYHRHPSVRAAARPVRGWAPWRRSCECTRPVRPRCRGGAGQVHRHGGRPRRGGDRTCGRHQHGVRARDALGRVWRVGRARSGDRTRARQARRLRSRPLPALGCQAQRRLLRPDDTTGPARSGAVVAVGRGVDQAGQVDLRRAPERFAARHAYR